MSAVRSPLGRKKQGRQRAERADGSGAHVTDRPQAQITDARVGGEMKPATHRRSAWDVVERDPARLGSAAGGCQSPLDLDSSDRGGCPVVGSDLDDIAGPGVRDALDLDLYGRSHELRLIYRLPAQIAKDGERYAQTKEARAPLEPGGSRTSASVIAIFAVAHTLLWMAPALQG